MTVLIVVFMFAVILLVDHFAQRRHTSAAIVPALAQTQPRRLPSIVAGFRFLETLRYHPGHTWVLSESPRLVRVGIDDFAARFAGKADRILTPNAGQWVRQGQKVFSIGRGESELAFVSPIEGTVVNVNQAVIDDPEIAVNDPYGEGWLMTVDAPDAKTSFRNLLSGNLVRQWLDEAATRLRQLVPAAVPALAQDGGMAVADIKAELTDEAWEKAGHEFFLV